MFSKKSLHQRVQQIISQGLRCIRESSFSPELEKIYYSSRNYFRGVGTSVFKRTGTSSVERELLRKEKKEQKLKAAARNLNRDKKVSLMVEYLGYSSALAEWIVDNDPDHDYSKLLLLEQLESA